MILMNTMMDDDDVEDYKQDEFSDCDNDTAAAADDDYDNDYGDDRDAAAATDLNDYPTPARVFVVVAMSGSTRHQWCINIVQWLVWFNWTGCLAAYETCKPQDASPW